MASAAILRLPVAKLVNSLIGEPPASMPGFKRALGIMGWDYGRIKVRFPAGLESR